MRRVLGFVLVAGLFVGGVAGCSSDSSSDSDKKADTSADEGSSSAANAEVAEYCDAVDAYVAKAKEAQSDPAKAAELSDEAQELATKATALATSGLSSADATAVADCTKRSTDALMPG